MLPKAVTSPQEKGGESMTDREFGALVRKILDERHIKHAGFAKDLGISPQLLNQRLKGGRWPLDDVMKAVKILNLPPKIFLS